MGHIKILNREISAKTLSAVWFGMSAALAVSILPGAQLVFLDSAPSMEGLKQPDSLYAPTMFVLHLVIPVLVATMFGGRLGEALIAHESQLSAKDAFRRGVKILLFSAIAWALGGGAWLGVMSMFTDVSRMYGGVIVLLLVGLPVYPFVGGVLGILLKVIARSRSL